MLQKGFPKTFDKLSAEKLNSFEKLIEALKSAQILLIPKPHQPYLVDTNALDRQIDCELFQTNEENILCPIEYLSRTLHATELNYPTTEKECLVRVWVIHTLHPN